MQRDHGVLAGHSRDRAEIVPKGAAQSEEPVDELSSFADSGGTTRQSDASYNLDDVCDFFVAHRRVKRQGDSATNALGGIGLSKVLSASFVHPT